MPHALWAPEQAARATLAALRWLTILPRTVRQDFSQEFVSGRGQTVNVLNPISAGEAKVYTPTNRANRDTIGFNTLEQTWTPVTLHDQVYNAVRLPDDFATFTLEQMAEQVLRPQAESVVDELAVPLLAEMEGITPDAGTTIGEGGNGPLQVAINARRILNKRKVPTAGRTLALAPDLAALFINLPELKDASASGTTGTLREAVIGRLFGFDVVEDPALSEGVGVAYHRDAFAHITRPSRQPEGAAHSATIAADGFALRWVQHYNPLQLEDQSVVDTFYGAATLDAQRAVGIRIAEVAPAGATKGAKA